MLTTITVNGSAGLRFLSQLAAQFAGALPPALAMMIDRAALARRGVEPGPLALEVDPWIADQIAAFVEHLVDAGFPTAGQPLLFSAAVGDHVVLVRDALVELARGRHELATWRFVPRGVRGRVVARRGDTAKLQLLDGPGAGGHAYVSDRCTTRIRR